MAEHDLWNEDDFFEKLKKEKRAAEQPPSPEAEPQPEAEQPQETSPLEGEPQALESDLFEKEEAPAEEKEDEDIFAGAEESLQSPEPQEIAQEFDEEDQAVMSSFAEEEQATEEPIPEQEEEQPAEQPPKKYALSDNYEDEKLAPVNYKPVIIGALVIILLIVLFFVLRGVFVKGNKEKEEQAASQQQTEQTQTAEKAQQQNPIQTQQTQFFTQIAGMNAYRLGLIQSIGNAVNVKNAQITNLLLYNDEITFEIHCKNRDVLAKATMNLRAIPAFNELKLISTDEWPGGAIDAVFHTKLAPTTKTVTPGPKISEAGALEQWLKMLGQQFSVKIDGFQQLETAPAKFGLNRIRVLFQGQGKYQGVMEFINALAAANRNIKIHKLVLTALSQKNFSKSNYRTEVTLDLFK